MVALARAHVGENPQASDAVRAFARVGLSNAEEGCHKLFREHGLCAPVLVERMELGEQALKEVPFVRLSTWAKFLLDSGRLWRQMCGAKSLTMMEMILTESWSRFRQQHPGHEVFSLMRPMHRVIPFFSHSDEGRTYKSKPIYILSCHGALGRGTQASLRHADPTLHVSDQQQGLNFVGNTWSNQFIFTCVVRQYMVENPDLLDEISRVFASDTRKLIMEGIEGQDGTRIYMLHIATKGDLPALAKLGHFERTFSHAPRQASSRKACVGICHVCMAGCEEGTHIPYENFSMNPEWVATVGSQDPWPELPPILEGLPMEVGAETQFFQPDLWHNMHLGCLKHWLGGSFAAVVENLHHPMFQGASVDARFAFLTEQFKMYCRLNKLSPHLSEISRQTMSWPMSSAVPVAAWSKGSASTDFMRFLDFFMKERVIGKTEDVVLLDVAAWPSLLGAVCAMGS